ncbi:hypothetical protein [uncultured Shewanella sp.]|uniref:hypothetical protein n=1 Tax=uncultured Shewanella sp. TaxID=173975 RepID=UPI0026251D23|nr:hypothetical protein [uncultured Shewanella sp.]
MSASGKAVDVNGIPVIGEQIVVFTFVNGERVTRTLTTDESGQFTAAFDLPSCRGEKVETLASNFGTPRDIWEVAYNIAQIVYMVPLSQIVDESKFHDNYKFIHICDETLIEHING